MDTVGDWEGEMVAVKVFERVSDTVMEVVAEMEGAWEAVSVLEPHWVTDMVWVTLLVGVAMPVVGRGVLVTVILVVGVAIPVVGRGEREMVTDTVKVLMPVVGMGDGVMVTETDCVMVPDPPVGVME